MQLVLTLILTASAAAYPRTQFLQALTSRVPAANLHFNKRFVRYSGDASGPITLHFSDDSTAICDVLVGADGIKSTTRKSMYNNLLNDKTLAEAERQEIELCIEPRFTGTVLYRGTVPLAKLTRNNGGVPHRALKKKIIVT